ncbi:hypothetical protein MOK15_20660 [Sphingobium sp. BYY-5]|uniref:hypothetical protein n=1 Tax=Sphingobium sp. BYY-5 TaxID=2926400 RepID=UPI001FA75055|nr:hypothetical protein [Sphingobium sp. BYY-5]MCI4592478.1 hypothetical protein [Sphingobium sp. BYY-5]
MLSFIGAHFPYLVVAAMSLFAGIMLFVSIEEGILARRERLARSAGSTASEAAEMESKGAQTVPTSNENPYRAVA